MGHGLSLDVPKTTATSSEIPTVIITMMTTTIS